MTERRLVVLIFALILLLYGVGITLAGLTGAMSRYVGPRLTVAATAAAVALLFLGALLLRRELKARSEPRVGGGFLVFMLPMVFGVLSLAHQPLDRIDVSGLSAMSGDGQELTESLPEDVLEFDEFNFYNYYTAIHEQPAQVRGMSVVMEGVVRREPRLDSGRFYLTRRLMWCCTADALTLPTLVQTEPGDVPQDAAWVRISGVVDVITTEEGPTPIIRATRVEIADRPDFDFVFAF